MPRIPCHTLGGLLAALALLPLGASAQTPAGLPGHAVKFVNNFPPGGPSDIIARSLSAELQKSLKQTFIVENKPGAAGNIGAEQVAKSTADGTTVLLGIDTVFTVNPFIYKRLAFKPASTIAKPQQAVDKEGKEVVLEARGRHDPCVVPRAVPIVEAMACLTLADHLLRQRTARI